MAKKDTEAQKPPLRLFSFDDLATAHIDAVVTLPGGVEGIVPMRELTYVEYITIGKEVAQPTPPPMGVDPVTKRPLYDYNNAGYLQQIEDAATERGYRRLLAALKIDVPGDTQEAKIDALKTTWGASVTRQLIGLINRLAGEGEARVAAKAETFHLTGHGGVAHPQGVSDDGSGVLEQTA